MVVPLDDGGRLEGFQLLPSEDLMINLQISLKRGNGERWRERERGRKKGMKVLLLSLPIVGSLLVL